MRNTKGFQDKTVLFGQNFEFVKQVRFAAPRFAYHSKYLALPVLGLLAGLFEMVDFLLAPHKAGQAALRRYLQPRA